MYLYFNLSEKRKALVNLSIFKNFKSWVSTSFCILLFFTTSTVNAQQRTASITVKDASFNKVLKDIIRQTGASVIYNEKILTNTLPVTVSFKDLPIEKALKELLKGQPLEYGVEKGNIYIRKKPLKPLTSSDNAWITVTGKTTNEDGMPLPGVNIRIQDTENSTISDAFGNFSLKFVSPKSTLIASFIGFKTLELPVEAEQFMNLVMAPYSEKLDDVQITANTGYQSLSKERATGSFEVVNKKELDLRVGPDIMSRLEGITSIQFDKSGGINRPKMTIRGLSSINGIQDPLIVVDNFPYEGDIKNLNPNDVESVTILKDAAAASIWGSRAANGVVVITTRKGQYNRPAQINFSSTVTLQEKPDLFAVKNMSSGEFIDLQQQLFKNGFYTARENSKTNRDPLPPVIEILILQRDKKISAAEANAKIDALRGHDIRDDYNRLVYKTGVNQQYSLSVSGGSKDITYLFSGGYDKNKDVLSSAYDRITFRSSNTYRPIKGLEISTDVSYGSTNTKNGRNGFSSSSTEFMYQSLADADGNAMPFDRYRGPYIDTAGGGKLLDWKYYPLENYKSVKITSKTNTFVGGLGLNYRFNPNFSADVKYQYQDQKQDAATYNDVNSFFTRNMINKYTQIDPVTGVVKRIVPLGGIRDFRDNSIITNNLRGQVNYNQLFSTKHELTAIAGAEVRQIKTSGIANRIYGYDESTGASALMDLVNDYPDFISGFTNVIPGSSNTTGLTGRYVSVYANAAYTYDHRYTVSGSVRRDASNLFGVETRSKWSPLWSVGASWNIDQESFYKDRNLPYLKMRMTYGYSGTIDPSQSAVTTISYDTYLQRYSGLTSAGIYNYGNPTLRWEKVGMFNLGLDFGLQNNRFSGSVEYYHKNAKDLLGPTPVDPLMGYSGYITSNVANMKGKGVDIQLNATVINSPFKWRPSLIMSFNTTEVTEYYNMNMNGLIADRGGLFAIVGKPVYAVYSQRWAGLDAKGNPQGYLNGEKSIAYNTMNENVKVDELVYNGSATPTMFGSFNHNLSYKNINLSFSISYKFNYYFRKDAMNYASIFSGSAPTAEYNKRWQNPGDELITDIPSMVYPNSSARSFFYQDAEINVLKADHIRLQYINLSYSLRREDYKRLPVKSLDIFSNISNLGILWRANKQHIDPDFGNRSMPAAKTVSFGLRANY
ncbi:SusC/RagA family TonB-linked outer membrane protein [Pedobacter gandavensis]|uniref:SusC/RagA family TonB-linked outer membrane protein n=1 Tax=Pedobacter gandavensis TaxID=2679963 RepID=UPI00292DCCD0|nr:SusC/RagA family TonB-linked outer membrane protein [Pedobacter gandavensis]